MTYVAVKSAELSVLRVLRRALEETRTVAQDVVLRRYPRSLANLTAVLPRLERVDVYDNSESELRSIARLDRGRIISVTNDMPGWAEQALRVPLAVARDRAAVCRDAVQQLQLNRTSTPAPDVVEEDISKRAFVAGSVLAKSEHHIVVRTGAWSYAVLERQALDREPTLREHVSVNLKNGQGHLRDPGAQTQDRSRKRGR
jgi:hypothetical protein